MATIGNLGSLITFEVSSDKILTFDKLTRTIKGRWATHGIIGGKPRTEFIGADLQSVSLSIKLNATHGVKPLKTLEDIEKAVERGTVMPLVIGGKKVGSNSWTITQASETWGCIYSKGELITANVSLTLQEYV